ncbi:MAG: enoyl-CoA hydratase-related protein, partial [Rhodospirillaceae bacterium]
ASIMLEGRIIQSEEAAAMGLINRILPEEEAAFEEALAEITASLSKGAPLVNAWHKKFIRRLGDPTPITPEELAECYEFLKTEDYREGQAAFKEKRKPSFNGR